MKNNKNHPIIRAIALFALLLTLAVPTRAADLSGTYTWAPVSIGAGGFVTGFCTNPANPAVRFCRTDIGNAYRWDNTNSVWVPMIVHNADGSGMPASVAAAPAGSGCEEIAIDPGNTNVVYMSAPFYYSGDTGLSSNNGTVWKSTDGGKNFTATGMTSTEGPNNSWRTYSERIKVDPNNSNKVYYGSLGNGLWVTTNGGTTWTNVSGGGVPATTTNVFNIAYYKGGGTTVVGGLTVSSVIYLDEAPNGTNSPSGGDVYKSTDGGQTWTNISSGAPVSGNAAKITVDQSGNIWVGSLTGANYYKYSGGVWHTITPGMNGAVSGLAVDPNNVNRVFLLGGGGDMARSLDGGTTWTIIQTAYNFANTLGWLPQNPTQTTYYWRSNAGIYFDANGVLFSPEGNEGMLSFTPSSDNHESTTNPPLWSIVSQGIEEFVTHDVILPAGEGDTAFINVEDSTGIKVTNPATYSASQVSLQGTQLISLGVGEAWCPNAPSYVTFTTMGNSNYSGYSSDLGVTWNIFGAAPASSWPGSIAVSRRGAWGLGSDHIVVLPDNNGLPIYSTNGGASWATTSSFPDANGGFWAFYIYPRQLRADPFTPDKFYLYDMTKLCVSTNGGSTWSSISSGTLPTSTSNGDLETNYLVQNDLWFADGYAGGTGGHGVWHSTNGGSTWTLNSFFTHAITMTLGVGDGVGGDATYTVYVYGCASDNNYGIFRSVNGGTSWDRLSYYPAGIFDQATSMAASWNTYGLVYITFTGNTAVYGKITGVTIPPAPTGLTATAGNAQVALSWTASSGATSYNVLRSTVSGSGYASVATGIATTSYTNTGLTNGTTYYFVVTATNSAGTSGNSNQASATPIAIPPAPTGLTATPGNAQVALSWNASSGATAYDVKRSTVSGSGYATVSSPTVTNYTNTGLTNGTTYYFVVDAKNGSGTSANSAQASATPSAGSPPPAPTGLTALPGIAQAWLTWTASTGATTYNVKRSTVSGSGYATAGSPATTYFMNTGLTNGTTYYFVVTAVSAGGESGNSSQVSAAPSATVPQAQIASGTATIDGTVEAAWSNAPAYLCSKTTGTISGYADCTGTWQGMWDATNLYILVHVTDDVKINDSTNPWDDDSIEIYLDADHNGGTTYDANDRQIDCGWGDSTPVEGAGRSITGAAFAKSDPTSTSYIIEAKVPWAIEAFTPAANAVIGIDIHVNDDDDGGARDGKVEWNDGTDLAWQNPSLFGAGKLLAGGSPPAAPTGLTATPGNAQVALSWTASSGATSYNVKRSTVSGSGYAQVANVTTTSYTNTGLTNGTTYYFVVSALNANGESANSSQASAAPVAPPAAPTGLTATPGNAQVALSWTASPGATAYDVKRSTVSGSGYVTVSSPTVTNYTNTGLTNGTTYYFVVDAKNAGGTSANSSQVSATPAAPSQKMSEPFSWSAGALPTVSGGKWSGPTTGDIWAAANSGVGSGSLQYTKNAHALNSAGLAANATIATTGDPAVVDVYTMGTGITSASSTTGYMYIGTMIAFPGVASFGWSGLDLQLWKGNGTGSIWTDQQAVFGLYNAAALTIAYATRGTNTGSQGVTTTQTASAVSQSVSQASFLVIRLDFTNNKIRFFINPDPGAATPIGNSDVDSGDIAVDTTNLPFQTLKISRENTAGGTAWIDEIRVADTFTGMVSSASPILP